MMTTRETIKTKTPEGESKQAVLCNGADAEEYVKHLMSFNWFMQKKRYRADPESSTKAVLKAELTLKRHSKVPKGEKDPAKAIRLAEVKAAEIELTVAKVVKSTVTCLAYNLFHKLIKDNPEIRWDHTVADTHTKDPWRDIKGVKHHGLREKSHQSLIDCIEQPINLPHKIVPESPRAMLLDIENIKKMQFERYNENANIRSPRKDWVELVFSNNTVYE
jgi:hypothetical protein